MRDAHDEYAPHAEKLRNSSDVDHEAAHEEHRPHLEAFEQAKAKAHKDFDDYTVKHNKAVDDANAELEPHKQAYNARHEAILAELQPHKDKRDAAYAAAEDVFAPHRQEYKRAAQVADDAVDEARKVWGDKVEAAQQEHEDSGRADVVRRGDQSGADRADIRADHEAAVLPRQAEQVIGAQACLHILERHVIDRLPVGKGMADPFEHEVPRFGVDDMMGTHRFWPFVRSRMVPTM